LNGTTEEMEDDELEEIEENWYIFKNIGII
jgi:hypothetical protein